jgi:hypothetical protein
MSCKLKTRNYRNLWKRYNEDVYVRSASRPGAGWYPVVALSRVHGAEYIPYDGIDEWTMAANRRLADLAESNAQLRRMRRR